MLPHTLWTDSHCHLADHRFREDWEEVLRRAAEAGVGRIVAVGDPVDESRTVPELISGHHGLYAALGVHPHHAALWLPESEQVLAARIEAGAMIALGEIGFDFHYSFSPQDAQRAAFLAQAAMARAARLPIIIHCRAAYGELIDLAKTHRLAEHGGIVHCFSGTVREARELAGLGFLLGIAGPLTFKKNAEARGVVRAVGIGSLVVETDAPYLAPEPLRGRRNEPAFVVHTGARLALELGMAPEDCALQTSRNLAQCLRLPPLGDS